VCAPRAHFPDGLLGLTQPVFLAHEQLLEVCVRRNGVYVGVHSVEQDCDVLKTLMDRLNGLLGTKKKFETGIDEEIEQKLIEACERLNRPQHRPHSQRLTWDIVNAIRARVAAGEKQSVVAAEYNKISTGLCCQIVKGEVWNPEKYRVGTKGREMLRRLYAAFDLGFVTARSYAFSSSTSTFVR
jgi:hypothetical protein